MPDRVSLLIFHRWRPDQLSKQIRDASGSPVENEEGRP